MKAGPVEIGTLLQNRHRFCIPIYQRRYVWNKNKQWLPFWQDIRSKAIERLAGKEQRFSHFMGAVVLESRAKPSVRQVPSYQVVDGQQRLTTFQLFLTAARHYAQKIGHKTSADNIRRYILNSDPNLMEKPKVEIYKVWPTLANRELFTDIVGSENRKELRSKYRQYWYKDFARDQVKEHYNVIPSMLGAYGYFYDRIRQAVETDNLHSDLEELTEYDPEEIKELSQESIDQEIPKEIKLDAIWQSLLEEFKVVEITLDEGDDAQVIFETLNDRGEPLLAADLVRNHIFQRADALGEDADELFKVNWQFFETPFWEQLEKQGRYKKKRIEFFLANFIAAKSGRDVTLSKLFSEYKAFLKPKKKVKYASYPTVKAEILDLTKYGNIYHELISKNSGSALSTFSKTLAPWDVSTVNPLVMRVWDAEELSEYEKEIALNTLLCLIVRRAVSNLGTKNYNNLFLSAVSNLDDNGWSLNNFNSFFMTQQTQSGRIPRDDEFSASLINDPIYSILKSKKTKAVLSALERSLQTKFQETDGLKETLSVEHVLPQNWYEHWPMNDGKYASEEPYSGYRFYFLEDDTPGGQISKRNRILHSLGNLTLVTQAFNSSLSNQKFDAKKDEISENSVLMLSKRIARQKLWNEEQILERGKSLAEKALKIWNLPSV